MGDPKKSRKKYLGGKPRRLWNRQLLEEELRLIGEYGLRNKRELWIAKAMLREIKHRARSLLSMPPEQRAVLEAAFKARLFKAGFLPEQDIPLDAVLSLDVRAILDRRLQTISIERLDNLYMDSTGWYGSVIVDKPTTPGLNLLTSLLNTCKRLALT